MNGKADVILVPNEFGIVKWTKVFMWKTCL